MHVSPDQSALADAFERIVHDLPQQAEFRRVEIVTTRLRRDRAGFALSVMVDEVDSAGVDIATCERVAARLNAALEAFGEPYSLEVESAGLDRPLVKPADYDRFCGANVRVISLLAINNAKTHRGKLLGLRDENIMLRGVGGEFAIPLEAVKSANIEFDIRADLQRAKRAQHERKETT